MSQKAHSFKKAVTVLAILSKSFPNNHRYWSGMRENLVSQLKKIARSPIPLFPFPR